MPKKHLKCNYVYNRLLTYSFPRLPFHSLFHPNKWQHSPLNCKDQKLGAILVSSPFITLYIHQQILWGLPPKYLLNLSTSFFVQTTLVIHPISSFIQTSIIAVLLNKTTSLMDNYSSTSSI